MLVTHGPLTGVTAVPAPASRPGRLALTVGNFDGVHRGHRAMLQRLKEKAAELGVHSCVLTFEPHPREFFAPQAAPARLTRLSAKLHALRDAGVDRVHVARFDAQFASQAPGRFIKDDLVDGLGCAWILVGRDFRFGAKRAGDFALLAEAARLHGFEVEAMPEVQNAGERISSSSVRQALKHGNLEEASALLGRPYSIAGRVTHGDKLGRELGFATANIRLPHPPPLRGIFVVEVLGMPQALVRKPQALVGKPQAPVRKPQAPGSPWPAVASIGVRPTVKESDVPLLEVHLFDFDQDLYGRRIEVRFLHKLRDENKYPDLETLKNAIAIDAADAREFFAAKSHG